MASQSAASSTPLKSSPAKSVCSELGDDDPSVPKEQRWLAKLLLRKEVRTQNICEEIALKQVDQVIFV